MYLLYNLIFCSQLSVWSNSLLGVRKVYHELMRIVSFHSVQKLNLHSTAILPPKILKTPKHSTTCSTVTKTEN